MTCNYVNITVLAGFTSTGSSVGLASLVQYNASFEIEIGLKNKKDGVTKRNYIWKIFNIKFEHNLFVLILLLFDRSSEPLRREKLVPNNWLANL